MAESEVDVDSVLTREIVYDGEGYTRDGLQTMLKEYQARHSENLTNLAELSKAHDDLAAEMIAELADQKSAWEYVGNIVKINNVGSNIKGLLSKIPLLREAAPERSVQELLEDKIEVAQRRVQQVANYLDTMHAQISTLQDDILRLNKRMIVAAVNEEKAAKFVLELERALEAVDAQLDAADEKNAAVRELETKRDQLKQLIWREGARLRLYSNAEDRIASIVRMNNNFMEVITNLHANMQGLYDTGNEVLNELEGNLASLVTAAQASELSLAMHQAMESLKTSVNKVAVLASETSLYLTQNVDRLTAQMQVYDDETKALVESNLRAEREFKEQRVDETINLARLEYGHFQEAKGEGANG